MNKRLKRLYPCLALCCALSGCGGASDSSASSAPSGPVYNTVLNERLTPVWADGGTATDETVFVIREKDGGIAPVSLAYPIEEIVCVRDFSLNIEYEEGTDYTVRDGQLVISETGNIQVIPYEQFYFEQYKEGESWLTLDGVGGQLMTEAQLIGGVPSPGLTQWQIAVTYRHSAEWEGAVPADKSTRFPRLNGKLNAGEGASVVCLGDSISAGWTASGYDQVFLKPYCPPYFGLISDYMAARWQGVSFANLSVGGMTSGWGAEPAQIAAVAARKPDLLIIAFGMNDGSGSGALSAEAFGRNIRAIVDGVRESCLDCEVLLVSTMLPNAEVCFGPGSPALNQQGNYAAALAALEAEYEGVALADVTAVHKTLLERKKFQDMSTNNINHPNDYMHRVYAQTALTALFGSIERVEMAEY